MHYSYTTVSMPATVFPKGKYPTMILMKPISSREQRKRKRISGTINTSTRPQVASTFPTPMEIDDDAASNHQSCLPVPMDVDDDTIATMTPEESSLSVPMDSDDDITPLSGSFPVPV